MKMTTLMKVHARLENLERYLERSLAANEALEFSNKCYDIKNDKLTDIAERRDIDYKANYERPAEIEKALKEHIARLVAENSRLNEVLKKWGIHGEQ